MRYPNEEIEAYRRNAGELENELIDEYRAGTLSRKELIQRGSVLGMSLPFLGLLAGPAQAAISRPMARPMDVGQRGGTIRIGTASIDASLEPPLLQTLAAISVTQISGEQLTFADKNASCGPAWRPPGSPVAEGGPGPSNSDGRPLPGREADDGRRRRRDVPPAARAGLAGAVVVQGRHSLGTGGRSQRRALRPRGAERALSLPPRLR